MKKIFAAMLVSAMVISMAGCSRQGDKSSQSSSGKTSESEISTQEETASETETATAETEAPETETAATEAPETETAAAETSQREEPESNPEVSGLAEIDTGCGLILYMPDDTIGGSIDEFPFAAISESTRISFLLTQESKEKYDILQTGVSSHYGYAYYLCGGDENLQSLLEEHNDYTLLPYDSEGGIALVAFYENSNNLFVCSFRPDDNSQLDALKQLAGMVKAYDTDPVRTTFDVNGWASIDLPDTFVMSQVNDIYYQLKTSEDLLAYVGWYTPDKLNEMGRSENMTPDEYIDAEIETYGGEKFTLNGHPGFIFNVDDGYQYVLIAGEYSGGGIIEVEFACKDSLYEQSYKPYFEDWLTTVQFK